MSDEALLAAFYTAYNTHDAVAAAALYAADGCHEEIAMAKTRSGPAELAAGLEGLFRMLPDVVWRPLPAIRSAEWHAIPYRMSGTFTPRATDPASEPVPRAVVLDGLHLLHIRDGKIRLSRDYWDLDLFLAQINAHEERAPSC